MCRMTTLTNTIFYVYNALWLSLPILYLIIYRLYKSRHKDYSKAFKIALVMFIILFIPKVFGFIFYDSCYNCSINHICKSTPQVDDKSDKKTTTTTSTTTAKTTTTTTSKVITTNKVTGQVIDKGVSSKGYKIVEIDGATYVNNILIVNKTYPVPENFVPKNTYKDASPYVTKVCNDCIDKEAYKAWLEMKADALAVGINLWIQSGYRPYGLQKNLYNNYVNRDGKEEADRFSARPGYSEHQTALCFDINNPSRKFNGTDEAEWINANSYRFGFIIRYPDGKEDETGYMYESWHVRYVGKELAEHLYNDGDWITLETYLGITSKYEN